MVRTGSIPRICIHQEWHFERRAAGADDDRLDILQWQTLARARLQVRAAASYRQIRLVCRLGSRTVAIGISTGSTVVDERPDRHELCEFDDSAVVVHVEVGD